MGFRGIKIVAVEEVPRENFITVTLEDWQGGQAQVCIDFYRTAFQVDVQHPKPFAPGCSKFEIVAALMQTVELERRRRLGGVVSYSKGAARLLERAPELPQQFREYPE